MGVDLFFVLSGFLITGILFDTAHVQARIKNFYAHRALRIFPLFYGVLFGFLLLTPVLHLQWHLGPLDVLLLPFEHDRPADAAVAVAGQQDGNHSLLVAGGGGAVLPVVAVRGVGCV
jgi:peptidoglycan/LPS O-acetylase OafA/YrhL